MPQVLAEARFSLPVNGVEITTFLVPEADMAEIRENGSEGESAEGAFDAARAIILISDGVPDHRRLAVWCHEFIHAVFGEVGPDTYGRLTGCPEEDAKKSEESLADYLGPILAAALPLEKLAKALTGPIRQAKKKGRK